MLHLVLSAALCALASAASSDEAQVTVLDLDGRPLASATLAVPPGGFVPGFAAMTMLHERGALRWKYSSMGGQPVVTEINGVKSALPRTAWILSATSRELGSTQFNVGMRQVDVRAGDVLLWQLWKIADLPPPPPVEEEGAGADAGGEDELADASDGEDNDYGGEDDYDELDSGEEEDEASASGDEL